MQIIPELLFDDHRTALSFFSNEVASRITTSNSPAGIVVEPVRVTCAPLWNTVTVVMDVLSSSSFAPSLKLSKRKIGKSFLIDWSVKLNGGPLIQMYQ